MIRIMRYLCYFYLYNYFLKHLKAIDKSYQIGYNKFELADTNSK